MNITYKVRKFTVPNGIVCVSIQFVAQEMSKKEFSFSPQPTEQMFSIYARKQTFSSITVMTQLGNVVYQNV